MATSSESSSIIVDVGTRKLSTSDHLKTDKPRWMIGPCIASFSP